ncbi:MAG: hypothetical protein IKK52_02740 [Alphaproteobacteria bacterium]|nr:hypothetical protein [Alphaproteobacteria bacterium]
MIFLRFMTMLSLLIAPSVVFAQGAVTLSEDIDNDISSASAPSNDNVAAPAQNDNATKDGMLEGISSAIGEFAQKNIMNAEQVFCYQIAMPPENYTGYTLDGMAIVGFCGIANDKLREIIIRELFSNPDHILFDKVEDCVVKPQIMLRFMRGIDATDVLLSSPCHAVAVFYGGKLSAFNAKPASTVIDNLIRPLVKNKIDFVSPTLFRQLLPIGVVKTDEQKALLKKKNEPFRRWEQNKQEKAEKSAGWNKLKSQR